MIDVLTKARARIMNPAHWTHSTRARGPDGEPVTPDNPRAVCWCLMGAIEKEAGRVQADKIVTVLRETAVVSNSPFMCPMVTNDLRGHAAAISLLDQTIARLICN